MDLAHERVLAEVLVAGSRDGMISAAHDVSEGGVATTLVEMALRSGTGARLWVPDGIDPFVHLFSESAGRAVVVVPRSEEQRFTAMCAARGLNAERIGVVDSGMGAESGHPEAQVLVMAVPGDDDLVLPLTQLSEAHRSLLPALFG